MPWANILPVWGLVVAYGIVSWTKSNQPKMLVCDADRTIACVKFTIWLTLWRLSMSNSLCMSVGGDGCKGNYGNGRALV